MKALLLLSVAATFALNAMPQASIPNVYWECGTPTPITLHDAGTMSERFTETLPGGAWDATTAVGVAAANFHSSIQCAQDSCEDPAPLSCIKMITKTYESCIPISQDPATGKFTYKIRGLMVTGLCGECVSAGQ